MALFWVACARLSDCKKVKGGSAWSRKLSHQVLRSLDVIRELKQGRFSATNVNRRWGLSFFIDATKFVSLSFFGFNLGKTATQECRKTTFGGCFDILRLRCLLEKTGEKKWHSANEHEAWQLLNLNQGLMVSRGLRERPNLVPRTLFHSSPGAIRSRRGP